jgi:hypothetical protein
LHPQRRGPLRRDPARRGQWPDVLRAAAKFPALRAQRLRTHPPLAPHRRARGLWAADKEPAFPPALARAGFRVEEIAAKAHERAKRAAHRIYVGERLETKSTAP